MYYIEYSHPKYNNPLYVVHVEFKELNSFISGLLNMGCTILNIYLEV